MISLLIFDYKNLNLTLLLFNLLPIIPLDGSKLVNILLNLFIPFKKSFIYTIYISMITLLIIIVQKFNLILILILIFILIEILKQYLKKDYYFNKFLLERYLYNFSFKKYKLIHSINEFYKNKKNIIQSKTERQILKNLFDK